MRLTLITGGSRGLGGALVQQAQARGDTVLEFSRSAPHPVSVRCDFADPLAAVDTVTQALAPWREAAFDELLVVHNAAVLGPIGPVARKPAAEVMAHLNTNVTAGILVLGAIVAAFQSHGGRKRIANISSGAATKAYAGWSLYCASKAGLEAWVRALAAEQQAEAQPFAAVNLNPGVMDTDMQALIRTQTAQDFPQVERFRQRQADGELQAPAVIAAHVLAWMDRPTLESGATLDATRRP